MNTYTYEKKYKDALEKAKSMIDDLRKGEDILAVSDLESMFPELKESEDERIRREIIDFLWKEKIFLQEVHLSVENNPKYRFVMDAIAWLEKQGVQNYKIIKGKNYFCVKTHNYAGIEWIKGTKYYASDNYTLVNQGCEYYCPEYSKEEHNNLFEEVKYNDCVKNKMSVDKVEPKFKVGEFVINSYDFIMKIVDIKEESYRYIVIGDNEEKILNCTFRKMEESCHLWDISDAKDGDVLTSTWKGCSYIYIFKEVDNNIIISHIFYYPELDAIDMGVINTDNTPTIPATKEQRDLLYQKIHDAGYEWDAENKELKKMEQKYDNKLDPLIDEEINLWIKENSDIHHDNNDIVKLMRDMACYVATLTRNLYRQKSKQSEKNENFFANKS